MEGFDVSNAIVWRALERLIGMVIGGGSIYLGYRLFMSLPQRKSDSEGKVELPGGISIYVSRVGPGVFFALFGTAIVALSFVNALRWEGPVRVTAVPPPQRMEVAGTQSAAAPVDAPAAYAAADTGSFSYVTGNSDGTQVSLERDAVVRDLRTLKGLETALDTYATSGNLPLEAAQADSLLIALPRIKRLMLHGVWDPDWGSYGEFASWVRQGTFSDPPAGLDPVIVAMFRRE